MLGNERMRKVAPHKKKDEYEKLREKLLEAIKQDPGIDDVTNISITVDAKGLLKNKKIELFGKVESEKDKTRAQEIVELNVEQGTTIENNLKIGS